MGYYTRPDTGFRLLDASGSPGWRRPQLAALGSLLGHWNLGDPAAALVSLPTGVGKTAVAMAAPHLLAAERVLVVVPSTELRSQTARQFRTQATLRAIQALRADGRGNPIVLELRSRVDDWEDLRRFDVVVALPNSISPHHYAVDKLPPADLFTLLVIDEAHHAPAPTWTEILEHFTDARALLLTATPRRRDHKQVPGKLVLYYPLRKALEERLFQPVDAVVLDVPTASRDSYDKAIAAKVASILSQAEHATSQLLVRASTIDRATALARRYRALGIEVEVVHSRLSKDDRRQVIDGLRAGSLRGVAVVGMLIEGFDLPSLRVAAYHDKHKSLETTAQLVGRLARVDASHPQRSVVVTVNDIDAYPELQGTVRLLYEEDHDWAKVLPGIIDDEIAEDQENIRYARSYAALPSSVDPAGLHPLRRAVVYEVCEGYEPAFLSGQLPPALSLGAKIENQTILYAGLRPDGCSLVVVTGIVERPRWNKNAALDSAAYELHGVAFRRSRETTKPHLLFVNTASEAFTNALVEATGAKDQLRPADTGCLQRAFDSLERLSVSSVGVRNTYSAQGVPSYRMFAGSGIESGMRHSDTGHASLGHAMVQVAADDGPFTAGVSTGKAKWWETRYTPLRAYDSFVTDLADRYWYPRDAPSGALLPQIARGRLLTAWPSSVPVVAEMDPELIGREWEIPGHGSLDRLELHVGANPAAEAGEAEREWLGPAGLRLWATCPAVSDKAVIWEGALTLAGQVVPIGDDRDLQRGCAHTRTISALLTERPPTVYFLDGTSVIGHTLYPPSAVPAADLRLLLDDVDWSGVDIRAETAATAARRRAGISIHEGLERYLMSRPRKGRHRWIICNDGPGEIADYLCIEVSAKAVYVGLWHAKYTRGEMPGVSVTAFEQVVAQAIKSRRWITDRTFWDELAARLEGEASPPARLVEEAGLPARLAGLRRRKLEILLGRCARGERFSFTKRSPQVQGEIGIVQPGLSKKAILAALESPEPAVSARQIQQLLTVWEDSLKPIATARVLCSA